MDDELYRNGRRDPEMQAAFEDAGERYAARLEEAVALLAWSPHDPETVCRALGVKLEDVERRMR